MKEPEIVVLNGVTRYDNWNNFFFEDKTGKQHRIGSKNHNLEAIAKLIETNPSQAVEISYGVFTNKQTGKETPYIKDVKLTDIKVDESKLKEQQVTPPAEPIRGDPKNRAFALSYSKDIDCAKIQAGKETSLRECLFRAASFADFMDRGLPDEAFRLYKEIQAEFKKEE